MCLFLIGLGGIGLEKRIFILDLFDARFRHAGHWSAINMRLPCQTLTSKLLEQVIPATGSGLGFYTGIDGAFRLAVYQVSCKTEYSEDPRNV